MKAPAKVLIVDDESSIRRALLPALQGIGFVVHEANTGDAALCLVREIRYDAVLLDINMPGTGGIQTCRDIRRRSQRVGILMLTVRDSEDDKVEALDAGADDYVTKPFQIRELAARIRAAVRRSSEPQIDPEALIRIGKIELNPAARVLKKDGETVRLTPKEYEVLHYLMSHCGLPITHSRLLQAVWGPEYGRELEYLRTFVRQLRKKIEDDPADPKYLITDTHVGYRLKDQGFEATPNASGSCN